MGERLSKSAFARDSHITTEKELGPVHGSLQSPPPGLRFVDLSPITEMGKTPSRYIGIWLIPTALTWAPLQLPFHSLIQ